MKMNVVVLTGRLTRDPELKHAQSGKAFAKFSLAVGRAYEKDGVDFINCTAWGKTAEVIAEYIKKGGAIGVQGSLRVSQYEKDGVKLNNTEVMVDRVEFLDTKKAGATGDGGVVSDYSKSAAESVSSLADNDDFPF